MSHGVDIESGYGGTRPSPYIEEGIVLGDDPRVGHQFWFRPEVSDAVRQDGASFALVTAEPMDIPSTVSGFPIVNIVAPETLGDDFAIVVRPDRYVAAVAHTVADVEPVLTTLLSYVR